MPDGFIYLASPYTSTDFSESRDHDFSRREQEQHRFEAVRELTANLLAAGYAVFSPITYSHQFVTEMSEKGHAFEVHYEAWKTLDEAMIRAAAEVWVLLLSGWDTSHGVTSELELAQSLGKPIAFLERTDDIVPKYVNYRLRNVCLTRKESFECLR